MSISKFISKITVQTAVYWSNPVADGYGNNTYTVAEINCRWDDVTELIMNKDGKEITCSAKLLVNADLDENGWLHLGTMESGVDYSNPKTISKTYSIQKIEKVSMIKSTTDFVRTVYL